MLTVLKKIFKEEGFRLYLEDNSEYFLRTNKIENYIVSKYTEEEFSTFFESERTNKIIKTFEQWKKQSDEVKKNTSLLICVKVDSIEKIKEKYKNQMMLVEEDEYFFRKYVLVYTEKSIQKLLTTEQPLTEIRLILSDEQRMKQYEENLYNDDEEFFVAMELIVKLPFTNLEMKKQLLDPLEKKIEDRLISDISNEYLTSMEKLIVLCKESTYLERLNNSFFTESKEDNLDNFFSMFEVN